MPGERARINSNSLNNPAAQSREVLHGVTPHPALIRPWSAP